MKYSHVLVMAFTVESEDPEGEDITEEQIQAALQYRVADICNNDEAIEACMPPQESEPCP